MRISNCDLIIATFFAAAMLHAQQSPKFSTQFLPPAAFTSRVGCKIGPAQTISVSELQSGEYKWQLDVEVKYFDWKIPRLIQQNFKPGKNYDWRLTIATAKNKQPNKVPVELTRTCKQWRQVMIRRRTKEQETAIELRKLRNALRKLPMYIFNSSNSAKVTFSLQDKN